ncbi:MAG: hypothetical protein KC613_13760 [Myxococcales bacterium]|nr:hypothetical protein [Myxococcales bacterium]MCB9524499.1 hypothetical protein [Myxococcales bacterium]
MRSFFLTTLALGSLLAFSPAQAQPGAPMQVNTTGAKVKVGPGGTEVETGEAKVKTGPEGAKVKTDEAQVVTDRKGKVKPEVKDAKGEKKGHKKHDLMLRGRKGKGGKVMGGKGLKVRTGPQGAKVKHDEAKVETGPEGAQVKTKGAKVKTGPEGAKVKIDKMGH